MSTTTDQGRFRCIVPTADATDNLVEDVETVRGSVMKVWPSAPDAPTRCQWMKLIETSEAFSFWRHPDEDIYTEADGEPV